MAVAVKSISFPPAIDNISPLLDRCSPPASFKYNLPADLINKLVPSNSKFASEFTVLPSTEVTTLLLPELVYELMAAAVRFVIPLPSPVIVVACTLPNEPVPASELLILPDAVT